MNLTRRAATSIAAGALLSGVAVATPAVASASTDCPRIGIGVGAGSDWPGGSFNAGYQPATVHPGDTLVWHFNVRNAGSCVGQFRVHDTLRASQTDLYAKTDDPWLEESPELASVEAGQRESVTVTATVPADAPRGDHFSMLWAYSNPTGEPISQVLGAGIRVWLNVQ